MNRFTAFSVAVLVGVTWLTVPGCGGLPRAPARPAPDDQFEPVQAQPPGMETSTDAPAPLALYPGDVVTLRTESAEVAMIPGLTVDARGMLHVPLAGDIDVAGVSFAEAERRIERGLQSFDATVRVTIILQEAAGHQASVLGAVTSQGRYAVTSGMRVADLLAEAGGPTRDTDSGAFTADLQLARLVRDGRTVPISVHLALTGNRRHNVRVRPGDHLYIPPDRSTLISVLGEVSAARLIRYQPGIRLSQALALAGGTTRDANGGDIRIVRGPADHPTVYRAAIDHVVAGDHPDPILAPGDIVWVGSSALADFRDAINAAAPVISLGATTAIGIAVATP